MTPLLLVLIGYVLACNMRNTGRVEGNILLKEGRLSREHDWGNFLSPYWQGRAMAAAGGLEYVITTPMEGEWYTYLPRRVPARPDLKNETLWSLACAFFPPGNDWQTPHQYPLPWPHIRDDMIVDTRRALSSWAEAHQRPLPTFISTDAVIQFRCAQDTVLGHSEYGPIAFSFYRHLPPETQRVFLVSRASHLDATPICRSIHEGLIAFVEAMGITVISQQGDTFTDFAFLVYAPVLFKAASSFGLVAGMANNGTVWTTPLAPLGHVFNMPRWFTSAAPVLYPSIGKQLGFKVSSPESILTWLREH